MRQSGRDADQIRFADTHVEEPLGEPFRKGAEGAEILRDEDDVGVLLGHLRQHLALRKGALETEHHSTSSVARASFTSSSVSVVK